MEEQAPKPEAGLPLGTLLVAGGVLSAAAAYFTFFSQKAEPPPPEPGSALSRPEVNLAPPERRPGGQAPAGRPTQDSTLSVVQKGEGGETEGSLSFLRKNADVVQVDRARQDNPFSQKDPAFDPAQAIPLGPALSFKGEDGPAKAGTQVIQTPKAWVATCRTLGVRDAPSVDFRSQMAVAVFSGEGPAGYGVEIMGAEEKGGKLQVTYRRTVPAPGQNFKGRARPYHIMAIPRSNSPVAFVEAK